jgi:hypothetical protein
VIAAKAASTPVDGKNRQLMVKRIDRHPDVGRRKIFGKF